MRTEDYKEFRKKEYKFICYYKNLGYAFSEIGKMLGVTKQAVYKKYIDGGRVERKKTDKWNDFLNHEIIKTRLSIKKDSEAKIKENFKENIQ